MLAVTVALLWGAADLLAARSASALGTLKATLVSQICGLLLVVVCADLALRGWPMSLSAAALERSVLLGLMSGVCGALGYLALYRALNLGPVALVSPLSSSSSTITLLLALVFLRERLSPLQMGCVSAVLLGIVLASANGAAVTEIARRSRAAWLSTGVPWALAASTAFGIMDFGNGASASLSNWLLPVVWTRLFGVLALLLISLAARTPSLVGSSAASRQTGRAFCEADNDPCLPTPLQLACLKESSRHMQGRRYLRVDRWLFLAGAAGLTENVAVLGFSLATRLSSTGMASAIASGYALVVLLYGLLIYRERLSGNQWSGVALFMSSLILLAR
jgi:transporter family protein